MVRWVGVRCRRASRSSSEVGCAAGASAGTMPENHRRALPNLPTGRKTNATGEKAEGARPRLLPRAKERQAERKGWVGLSPASGAGGGKAAGEGRSLSGGGRNVTRVAGPPRRRFRRAAG